MHQNQNLNEKLLNQNCLKDAFSIIILDNTFIHKILNKDNIYFILGILIIYLLLKLLYNYKIQIYYIKILNSY